MSQLLIALSCVSSSPRSVFKLLAPHDVDVHDFEVTGRGLRTLRDRELGEALLELPDSSVVLAERVLETDSCLAAAAAHPAELGAAGRRGPARLLLRGRWATTRGCLMHGARCAVHHVFINSSLSRSNLSVYSDSYLVRLRLMRDG